MQARAAPQAPAGILAAEAAPKPGDGVDGETVKRYRLEVILAARQKKFYPKIAIEKGWQGRVEVHMVIGATGMIASASIKSSSGHDVLDKQALDTAKIGRNKVPIPASLRGREFSIDIPVIFDLDNPNS